MFRDCVQTGRARTPVLHSWLADFDCAALHGTLQGLVQRGFSFLILLLRDSALLVFDLELEDLFFQAFEEHGSRGVARGGRLGTGFADADLAGGGNFRGFIDLGVFEGGKCLPRKS